MAIVIMGEKELKAFIYQLAMNEEWWSFELAEEITHGGMRSAMDKIKSNEATFMGIDVYYYPNEQEKLWPQTKDRSWLTPL